MVAPVLERLRSTVGKVGKPTGLGCVKITSCPFHASAVISAKSPRNQFGAVMVGPLKAAASETQPNGDS